MSDPIGGPIDPDATDLLHVIQSPGCEARDHHLVIRGLHRWPAVDERNRWVLSDVEVACISAETVAQLKTATAKGGLLVIDGHTFALVLDKSGAVPWALLEPAIGGPSDPDIGGPIDPDPPRRS